MTELQREPDPKLMRELGGWGNAHDSYSVARTDKEKRSIDVEKRDIEKEICDYLKSKASSLKGCAQTTKRWCKPWRLSK